MNLFMHKANERMVLLDMINFEDFIINMDYKITEITVSKRVNRNAYTGQKTKSYLAQLIKKDDESKLLTFNTGNGWEKAIYYDLIGTSKRGTMNIEKP